MPCGLFMKGILQLEPMEPTIFLVNSGVKENKSAYGQPH